jgi:hypothetical protein
MCPPCLAHHVANVWYKLIGIADRGVAHIFIGVVCSFLLTMAESDKNNGPNSNNKNDVDTVKIIAEHQQNLHPQRSPKIMVVMQTNVRVTKQVQFRTNLHAVIKTHHKASQDP